MEKVTKNTKKLQECVLKVLKRWDATERGWWHGHEKLHDELRQVHRIDPADKKLIKEALRTLKSKGLVITQPIFDMDGKLNGSGWFFDYYNHKNDMK